MDELVGTILSGFIASIASAIAAFLLLNRFKGKNIDGGVIEDLAKSETNFPLQIEESINVPVATKIEESIKFPAATKIDRSYSGEIALLNRRVDHLEKIIEMRDSYNKWLIGLLFALSLGLVTLAASVAYQTINP